MEDEDYSEDYDSDENPNNVHCFCYGHCPFDEGPTICQITTGGKCFAAISVEVGADGNRKPVNTYGCLPKKLATLQCKGSLVPHLLSKSIQCCNDSDFCNRHLLPSDRFNEDVSFTNGLPFIIFMSSLGAGIILAALVLLICCKFRKDRYISDGPEVGNLVPARTISKQLEMEKIIVRGQFGEVWLAKWRGEKVAVKICNDKQVWMRETDIYQTVLMRQDNILGFIAADINFIEEESQVLLITEYHELGSLSCYLLNNTFTRNTLLQASKSIARGLAHLHVEILGIPGKGKPTIIHNDLNSKNILMKRNGECCIAGFGNATKYNSQTNDIDLPEGPKYGTLRYLAPEVLNNTIDVRNFDAHKMVDIYAFGLILWEMARRFSSEENIAEQYMLPFEDMVTGEPTFEEMTNLVCTRKLRPIIPERFYDNQVLKVIAKLIQEMWNENSPARLTALRVKKTLNSLVHQDYTVMHINGEVGSQFNSET